MALKRSASSAVLSEVEFVPGIHSVVGRNTEFALEQIRQHADLEAPEFGGGGPAAADAGTAAGAPSPKASGSRAARTPKAGALQRSKSAVLGEGDGASAAAAPGELARAIQERVRLNAALRARQGPGEPGSREASPASQARPGRPAFPSSSSPDKADRCDLKVQYGFVASRSPAWDIGERPRHISPVKRPDGDSFLTGVDLDDDEDWLGRSAATSPSRRRGRSLNDSQLSAASGKTAFALNTERPHLGKIGRVHVIMNEVTGAAEDLHEQDIKGQPKLRYPHWDFEKSLPRPPLMRGGEDISAPGKYDIIWGNGVTSPTPKSGIAFDRALARDATLGQLGHCAPCAALLPEQVRSPGVIVVPDRSTAKDSVRRRPMHVNDFARELPRPGLPVAAREYHDQADPAVDAEVLLRQLTFDAISAEATVRRRLDVARSFAGMAARGRDAVQGIRALQDDVGVRGAAGMGTIGNPRAPPQAVVSTGRGEIHARIDRGPRFERYTAYQPTLNHNNFNHGHPPVQGGWHIAKKASMRRPDVQIARGNFERQASAPGFQTAAAAGPAAGSLRALRQSRSHAELPGWGPELLGEVGGD